MERIAGDVQRLHLGIGDLDTSFIGSRIEHTLDFQTGLCRSCPNQFDDRDTICE
jgi:hypothetical protein